MHSRAHRLSLAERVASLATATAATLGTALVVLTALRPTFVNLTRSAPSSDLGKVSERVMYVAPPASTAAIASTRQEPRPSAPADSRALLTTAREPMPALRGDSTSRSPGAVSRETATPRPAAPRAAVPARTAGAPVAAAIVGFTPKSDPVRGDSVIRAATDSLGARLASGRLVPPPPTREERDVKLRAQAFEAAVARGAGEPVRYLTPLGGVAIPLPFGGPSRKQRERDRAMGAELAAMRAARQLRIDSVVAARQRRRTDSLARLADSVRQPTRQPH